MASPTGTKIESYSKLTAAYKATKEEAIFQLIKGSKKALTRSEVAEITGWKECSCTARIKSLLDKGKLQVMGTRLDPATNRTVEVLVAVDDVADVG